MPVRKPGRANQKARTRTALLQAATELVREGRPPSIPEAADRALISVATAYRYFSSPEALWWEASEAATAFPGEASLQQIDEAGDDPQARLEALVRGAGFRMMDDQVPYRLAAKAALDHWFRRASADDNERVPIRQGRRNELIQRVIAPLDGELPKRDLDRIAHALGLVIGAEAMISLIDAVGLDAPAAKESLLDASRWLVAGALAELKGREAD